MGKYTVEITQDAREHLKTIYKSGNKILIKKVEKLFLELSEHPYTGSGRPEQLKFVDGIWSRRIDAKHRIRYTVNENIVTVYVLTALGHYGDK